MLETDRSTIQCPLEYANKRNSFDQSKETVLFGMIYTLPHTGNHLELPVSSCFGRLNALIRTGLVTGQTPPGHVPPAHLPQGHIPPGHLPPGHLPLGHIPPSHLPPGHLPPGHLPPGHLPPRTHTPRSLTPWSLTPWILTL